MEPFADQALERALEDIADRLRISLSGHEVVLRGTRLPAVEPHP
jgi:hypothetical protein